MQNTPAEYKYCKLMIYVLSNKLYMYPGFHISGSPATHGYIITRNTEKATQVLIKCTCIMMYKNKQVLNYCIISNIITRSISNTDLHVLLPITIL